MFIIYNCRTMSLLEVYHICISNSTLYTSYNLYFLANSQRKHQVQTRHFDRKSTQNATSFHLAIETVLLGVLACFSSAFLAVRRLQTDRKSGLIQQISHTALLMGFFQLAEVGVLFTEQCQSLSQAGIVGVDMAVSSPSLKRMIVSFSYFVSFAITSLHVMIPATIHNDCLVLVVFLHLQTQIVVETTIPFVALFVTQLDRQHIKQFLCRWIRCKGSHITQTLNRCFTVRATKGIQGFHFIQVHFHSKVLLDS